MALRKWAYPFVLQVQLPQAAIERGVSEMPAAEGELVEV